MFVGSSPTSPTNLLDSLPPTQYHTCMALVTVTSTETHCTYIVFRNIGSSKSGKTLVFEVLTKDSNPALLGRIEWNAHWRKYWFLPGAFTGYEEVCMEEIAEFLRQQTAEHRAKAKAARA